MLLPKKYIITYITGYFNSTNTIVIALHKKNLGKIFKYQIRAFVWGNHIYEADKK